MSNSIPDAYEVLGVQRTASAEEIKKAHRSLIQQVHPDKLANAPEYWKKQAEEKATDVNEAYRILSDPELRRKYDAELDSYIHAQAQATQTRPRRPEAQATRSSAASAQTNNAHPVASPRPQGNAEPYSPLILKWLIVSATGPFILYFGGQFIGLSPRSALLLIGVFLVFAVGLGRLVWLDEKDNQIIRAGSQKAFEERVEVYVRLYGYSRERAVEAARNIKEGELRFW